MGERVAPGECKWHLLQTDSHWYCWCRYCWLWYHTKLGSVRILSESSPGIMSFPHHRCEISICIMNMNMGPAIFRCFRNFDLYVSDWNLNTVDNRYRILQARVFYQPLHCPSFPAWIHFVGARSYESYRFCWGWRSRKSHQFELHLRPWCSGEGLRHRRRMATRLGSGWLMVELMDVGSLRKQCKGYTGVCGVMKCY